MSGGDSDRGLSESDSGRELSGVGSGRGLSGGDSGREFDLGPMADGWVGVGVGTVGAVGCGDLVCMSGWPCC